MAQLPDMVQYEIEMAALVGLDPDKVARGTIATKEPQAVEWSQVGFANLGRSVLMAGSGSDDLVHHVMPVDEDTYQALLEVEARRRSLFPTLPPTA